MINKSHKPPKPSPRKYAGFTLVELIVVITILVILGTIAFISLGGYSLSARDSARVSDISNITKALEITLLKNGSVIPPDKGDTGIITITASGTTIGYQGYAASMVLSNIKMNEARDPLDKKYYTYFTNANYTKYQVLTLLENSNTLTQNNAPSNFPLLDTAFAGYETRIPSTKGSSLGVLLGNTGATLNQPVQESYNVSSFTGVDVVNTSTGYMTVFSKGNSVNGSGIFLFTTISAYSADRKNISKYDNSLVGYWDMETLNGIKLKDLSEKGGDGSFVGTSNTSGKIGSAKSFNGQGDYINTGKNFSQTNGTIGLWFKVSGSVGVNAYLLGEQQGNSTLSLSQLSSNQKLSFWVINNLGTSVSINSTNAVNDNLWHYAVVVWGSNGMKIYIDGILNSSDPSIIYDDVSSTNLVFGGINQTTIPAYFYPGSIDEVRIYNRVLSDSEILSLYNATK